MTLVDKRIQTVAKVVIEVVHPTEIDGLIDAVEIAAWLLQTDHFAVVTVVAVVVEHIIAGSSKLEDFHDLYGRPRAIFGKS